MTDLPEFYFRIRENGAAVYRVSTENRQRRIEMTEIAVVNVKNGNVRPHGEHVLSDAEEAAIAAWMEARRAELSRRDLDDIHRTIDHLNLTAHWAQSRATEAGAGGCDRPAAPGDARPEDGSGAQEGRPDRAGGELGARPLQPCVQAVDNHVLARAGHAPGS
jgi:hypothetical protein